MNINLNNITLIGIDSREDIEVYNTLIKIADYSSKYINFGKIKILTGIDIKHKNYEILKIKFDGNTNKEKIQKYSKFCMSELNNHIDTDFCLLFQTDGFIINPHLWNDEFLNYDYIGAPWPKILGRRKLDENKRVGNGGFSLRSKKLLQECTKLNSNFRNEDMQICYIHKKVLQNKNIKFCPIELAATFSIELNTEYSPTIDKVFGFHGKHLQNQMLQKINENIETQKS